jgi:hypothetical protein
MSREALRSLDRLAEADALLDAEGVARLTLDPQRARASSLRAIGQALLDGPLPAGAAMALAEGLVASARAIRTHFPDNLFWDLDHVAASALREAMHAREVTASLRASFAEVVALCALFGRSTPIRFRYAHDFLYGFDWAKWVRRDPSTRTHVGPFDRAFLRAMRVRGAELLALIATGDRTYPPLRDASARNPFRFSREPDAELSLHRDLARRGLVPVRAWTLGDAPVWNRRYAEEREARARVLGLVRA